MESWKSYKRERLMEESGEREDPKPRGGSDLRLEKATVSFLLFDYSYLAINSKKIGI